MNEESRDHLVLLKDAYPSSTTLHISDPAFSNGEGLYRIDGVSGNYEILRLTKNLRNGTSTATRGLYSSPALKHENGSLLQPATEPQAPKGSHGTP